MRILVLGYIVRGPLGGMSWHHLQYILGLKELGHEVLFAEDSDDYPGCYNPETNEVNKDSNYGLNYLDNLFKKFDLGSQWSYFDAHTNKWFGQNEGSVRKFCDGADMVLNISGINPERDWWSKIPLRVLIDTDPAFTQIRHLTEEGSNQFAAIHNCFFSFGENFGKDFCTIPRDAYNWLPTRQPVYLKAWKSSIPNPDLKWTTVMQWDSYKSKEFNDKMYGMKSISFQDYVNFPEVMPDEKFELALGAEASIVENLKRVGWEIINPLIPTKTPWSYQQYVHDSKGEWSVAKHGYVTCNSGWFSERSLGYLASGKPAVIQDTGFSKIMETGKGVVAFKNINEAVEAVNEINSNYKFHCTQARIFAEINFNSQIVLQHLIDRILKK